MSADIDMSCRYCYFPRKKSIIFSLFFFLWPLLGVYSHKKVVCCNMDFKASGAISQAMRSLLCKLGIFINVYFIKVELPALKLLLNFRKHFK